MKCMQMNRGFMLLELMVALAIFALIASVSYAALVPAGEGFRMLQAQRDVLESSYQMERRLRMDVSYLMRTTDKSLVQLKIFHDQRGGGAFDSLTLLVSDSSSVAPVQVHYELDEESGHIVRTSSAAWLRKARPVRWQMQQASSFEVQALNRDGRWLDVWETKAEKADLPEALRVRWQLDDGVQRELLLPVSLSGDAPQ